FHFFSSSLLLLRPLSSPLFPYTTLFRSVRVLSHQPFEEGDDLPERGRGFSVLSLAFEEQGQAVEAVGDVLPVGRVGRKVGGQGLDRKSTRLNSSHVAISYAVFCLKKKIK